VVLPSWVETPSLKLIRTPFEVVKQKALFPTQTDNLDWYSHWCWSLLYQHGTVSNFPPKYQTLIHSIGKFVVVPHCTFPSR
jgi:hypothetical protein